MKKHLLYICVLILAGMTSAWAQAGKGNALSFVVKEIRPIPAGMKSQLHSPRLTPFISPQEAIFRHAVHMGMDRQSNNWAQSLITPTTKPAVAKLFLSLGNRLSFMRTLPVSQFTPEQLARIDGAQKYFFNLTPEQANSISTLSSETFRENAMVLRSPAATEYGYFFMGYRMAPEYEFGERFFESGYIPVMRGNANDGISTWNMKNLISSATKTDRPIFVALDVHGGINLRGNFHVGLNSLLMITTKDIVSGMQELRAATGTPELNLFVSSCMSGAFLDEFESLPLAAREGINVFVPTGAGQCTYISQTALYHSHVPGRNISKELIEKMIQQLVEGKVMVQANIAGQSFNPLQLAIEKANSLSDERLTKRLTNIFNLQKTKQYREGPRLQLQDEKTRYFIARTAYEEASARYGNIFEGNDWFNFSLQQLKKDYASYQQIDPFLLNWDAEFGFEPLK